ncbi:Degenerin mec-10 like protein [Argiope bruennichi]|uniref:Degenerin mec-10 like protein n=1 Tax=Argiope bruennichi TaxID=94029 RepID=A0A8T0FNE9_ARGBR|nr:Degenerin mec-10 like protein [Argiope bruennichi]
MVFYQIIPLSLDIEGDSLLFSERRFLHRLNQRQNDSKVSVTETDSHLELLKEWYEMDETQRYKKGHNPLTFLQNCTFDGKMCPQEYLSNHSDFRYGNCVSFNKRKHTLKTLNVSKTGPGSGLHLSLYFESKDYMPTTHTIGAILTIHNPEDIPRPEEKGHIITPGFETFIGLKQVISLKLQDPYKDHCKHYRVTSENFTRSKNECIRTCIQMRNFDQCGCVDPTYGIMNNLRPCDISNVTESYCLNKVLDNMSRIGPICDCPSPCLSVSYKIQSSKSLLRFVYTSESSSLSRYDRARVNIFYSSLDTQVFDQQPRWEVSEFLSILGNEFGESISLSERKYLYSFNEDDKNSKTTDAIRNSDLELIKKWYQMDEEERFRKGHDPSTFIRDCTFNGNFCPQKYLSNHSNLRYGNCVTFNKRTSTMKSLNISKTGVGTGLYFNLCLESEMYMSITPAVGAILVIHDPEDTPTPEVKAYIIPPGYETFISLKQTIFTRLPSPYKDQCLDYSDRTKEFTRNEKECMRNCIQMKNFEQCECIDPTLGILNEFRSCDISNDTQLYCLNNVLEYMIRIGPICNCPPPCTSVMFREQLSQSLLHYLPTNKDVDCPRRDIAKVNIFFPTLEKRVYEQRPRWEIFEIISILGNEFSLWLGSSLLISVEILERLISFVRYAFSNFILLQKRQKN